MDKLLNHLNFAEKPPKKGDVLVITTKKSKGLKLLVEVKDVVINDVSPEIILSKSSYFIWDMYEKGDSWVWRVWNLGNVNLTTSVNNFNRLTDY